MVGTVTGCVVTGRSRQREKRGERFAFHNESDSKHVEEVRNLERTVKADRV